MENELLQDGSGGHCFFYLIVEYEVNDQCWDA